MLQKKLACWSTLLVSLFLSCCDRIVYKPVEHISHWTLTWEEARPCDNSLRRIDLKDSVICNVPSEQAVYCLSPNGDCWKFIQDPREGLTCSRSTSFPGVSGQQTFFAFPAGSVQEQTLHVGILDAQQVKLIQYKGDNWETVGDYTLDVEALKGPTKGAAGFVCGEENQLNGLIALKPQAASQPSLITLVYDAATKSIEVSNKWNSKGSKWGIPKTVVEVAPSILFLVHYDTQYVITRMTKSSDREAESYEQKQSEQSRLFVLQERECMKKIFNVLYVKRNGKTDLKFYTLGLREEDGNWGRAAVSDLPEGKENTTGETADEKANNEVDHSESLVLPFSDVVYVLTQDKNGKSVYYKGRIQSPSQSTPAEE